jgi:hypothetical protein
LRRTVWIIFFIVLCSLFFWRDLLSLGLHGIVQWQFKSQIAFRQLSFQKGQIVLDDALLLNCSSQSPTIHIHAKKICIAIKRFKKPFHVHIAVDEPHIAVLQGVVSDASRLVASESKWFRTSFSVERGTFEWQDGERDPLSGRFSYENKTLKLDIDTGSMKAQWISHGREGILDCSFDQMPIAPVFNRLAWGDCHGRISGTLLLNIDQGTIQSASGRLRWDDALFSVKKWQARGGAELIEWEGEHTFGVGKSKSWLDAILSFPDRMKIKFHSAFISRGQSCYENLEGMFSCNQGVGLCWELSGPAFSFEGKGFSKSRSANWLESCLSIHEERLSIRAEQLDATHSRTVLELDDADPVLVRLIHDLWPAPWPCQFERGTLSARLIWEESDGLVQGWNLEKLKGSKLAIRADNWSLQGERIEAALDHEGNGAISISDSSVQWGKINIFSMKGQARINQRTITEGSFDGMVNGLTVQGNLTGSFDCVSLCARHKCGEQSIQARADLFMNGAGFDLSAAHLEARHLDLNCLRSFFAIDCEGMADLALNYANSELNLDGAGEKLKWIGKAGEIVIDRIGKTAPFEAGVKAVWDKASGQWTVQTAKTRARCSVLGQNIAIDGQLEIAGDQLKICVGKGQFDALEFAGEWIFYLEENMPFSFVAQRIDGGIESIVPGVKGRIVCENNDFSLSGDLLSNPSLWKWRLKARLSEIQWGLLQNGRAGIVADSNEGLIECCDVSGCLAIGNGRFGLCASQLRKCDQTWRFDFRLEHGMWDWGRLAGCATMQDQRLLIQVDSSKSHLLNSPIHVQESLFAMDGSIESMKLFWRIGWSELLAASPILEEIDHSLCSLLSAPVQGAVLFGLDFGLGRSSIQLQGEDLRYHGEAVPLMIRVDQQKNGWKIDRFLLDEIDLSCALEREETGWKIEKGRVKWKDHLEASIGGYLRSFSQCDLVIENLLVNLQNLPFSPWPALRGRLEGKGHVMMEYRGAWNSVADLVFQSFETKSGCWTIDNAQPIQIHFSNDMGWLIHGLDFRVHQSDLDGSLVHGRIDLLQFDVQRHHWVFYHSQVKLPADSIPALRQKTSGHPLEFLMKAIDCQHDLEFVADIDCAEDFSSLSCSMREGFIPFLGAVRHIQNVNLNYSASRMRATMSVIQGGHSLKIGAWTECAPSFWGRIFLEDEEHSLQEGEMPLTIEWGIEPGKELMIRSIEGTFGGIEASFHAQNSNCLIGSTRVHFGPLAEILPPRLGKVFRDLQMGKGYELKGHLFYDSQNLSNISFRGLMSGKQCDLFGFQIRTLLTQVEIHSSHVHLYELKASDSAGILTIDEIQMEPGSDGEWTMSMHLLKLMEFRPSLLQKALCNAGRVGPLVVRELNLIDLRGNLEESSSFTAKGDLHFVNSFKRQHTVFDLPADLFGRIIGLDSELLVPVRGKFKFELKEGRFWLSDLEDAYSEGQRSKFFLVKEGLSPSIDLDGNLHIFVTMKQYVLFKITENFLLTIDGPIESPSFHLQKKSKLLGLCGY